MSTGKLIKDFFKANSEDDQTSQLVLREAGEEVKVSREV